MKRSICYLYEYKDYKQTKNVGFMKTTFYMKKVTFQIHGKGLDCDKFMDLEMFLFTENANTYEVDRVGYVEGYQGAINYIVTVENLDAEKVGQYDGVLLESKNKARYVGCWKKKEVKLINLQTRDKKKPVEECPCVEEISAELCSVEEENLAAVINVDEVMNISEDETEVLASEAEVVCEIESVNEVVVSEIEAKDRVQFQKIDRHGIAELPQREWKLANNNFLLHGFTNYKHLMFIKIENKLYLGVPGVYHNREEAVAKSFGFPYFQKGDVELLELEDVECSTEENFGYWCRPVTERQGRAVRKYGEIDKRKGA